jgi:hypothetical protein
MITSLFHHARHGENVSVTHDVDVLLYELDDDEPVLLQHEA